MSAGRLTFASAYAGLGGLDLGFRLVGFEPTWANELDPDAAASYEANLSHAVARGDIEALELPGSGAADVVIGGPPCQGFSIAGRMDPGDPRSGHVTFFLDRLVRAVQPRAFVMENVKALAINPRWSGVRGELWRLAEELGYEARMFVLNAADFGVPQARERMFFVGVRGAEPLPPVPTTPHRAKCAGETLRSLPPLGAPGNSTQCSARVTMARKPVLRKSPFAGMLFNGKGRPLRLSVPALTLPATMGGNRTPIIDQEELEHEAEPWVVGYHRRLWEGGKPLKRAPSRLRRLTVEEAACLQGFPAEWSVHGFQNAQYRQIGNAVPPQLALNVAAVLASQLRRLSTRSARGRASEIPLARAA